MPIRGYTGGGEGLVRACGYAARAVSSFDKTRCATSWKRHPRKDLQQVLEVFAAQGWRIDDPPRYYRLRCLCGSHVRWFHLTCEQSPIWP